MLTFDSSIYNWFIVIDQLLGIYKEYINLLNKEWWVFFGNI